MKVNYIKLAALSLVLVSMATSCQKDSEMISSQELSQKSLAQENVILFYSIDDKEYRKKFVSKEERNDYVRFLLRLTTKGYTIVIRNNEKPNYAPENTKEQTFTTKNEDEMYAWLENMSEKHEVKITFDPETGTYTGTAIPNETRTTTTAISTERDTDSM